MYCKKCGTKQMQGQKFCPNCGTAYIVEDASANIDTPNVEPKKQKQSQFDFGKYISVKNILIVLTLCVIIVGAFLGVKVLKKGDIVIFDSKNVTSDVEGVPFRSSEKGRWGMLQPDGTILFEEEFKDMPTLAREGVFMVRNGNGLWEIFTATRNPEKVGDEYVSIGDFYHGVAPAVKKNEHITLIDKEGNVIAVLDKSGSKPITRMENFHYGYALFEADDAVGIINTKGEILLEAKKYCKIYHVAPDRFLALDMKYKEEEDRHNFIYDVIDPTGIQKGRIRMAKYDDIAVLSDGYIGIEQTSDGEKLYGIIDLEGNVIVKPTNKIQGLSAYKDGKFVFSNGEALGVRTIDDKVLIRPKYDVIIWATDELLWVNSAVDGHQEWSLIDLDGNKISKDSYQDVLPFYDEKNAFVQITDKTWGVVNRKGEEIKDVPDICSVAYHSADEVIVSDFVDFDAIVSAIKMTSNGFGGFGIKMSPAELVKVYNENCEEDSRLKLDPNEINTDQLHYSKEIQKGVNLNVMLYYLGNMVERGESYYDETVGEWIQNPVTWTKEYPQYIKMTVSGYKMGGRTNLLYKKLVVKAKSYGKVYKENSNACVIIGKNKNGLIIVDAGSEVWAMVKSEEAIQNEDIEQYMNN